LTNRQQTKRERQTAKKRAEREARIRAAKRRQRQRLMLVVAVLAAAGIGTAALMMSSGGGGGFSTGGGKNCGDAQPESQTDPNADPNVPQPYPSAPPMQIDCDKQYTATITTNHGDIVVRLHDNDAPVTVNNFVALARDGFYDGLTFHRVIDGFMIQGGDPKGDGSGGPGYKFQDEFVDDKNFDRPYRLAMANSGANTNGSQFFITVVPTEHLNQRHTIFGQVIEGTDVVDAIAKLETDESDKPLEPVTIVRIEITESDPEPSASPSPSPTPTDVEASDSPAPSPEGTES